MGIVSPTIKVRDSKHRVVFSHDPDVVGPRHAGWIPVSACESLRDGADVIEVRGLNADELARYIEGIAADHVHSSGLDCVRAAVVSVRGDTSAAAVEAWVNGAYLTNSRVVRYLTEYILLYSRGVSPVEQLEAEIEKAFGVLPTFLSYIARVKAESAAGGVVG